MDTHLFTISIVYVLDVLVINYNKDLIEIDQNNKNDYKKNVEKKSSEA